MLFRSENALLCLKSNVILDIQHKSQQGLTMRVFEALASKCKLITTNENIKRYDFFNERNVQVINRNDLNLDMEIFESQFYDIPCDIVDKYSLSNWISRIFDCDLYDEK